MPEKAVTALMFSLCVLSAEPSSGDAVKLGDQSKDLATVDSQGVYLEGKTLFYGNTTLSVIPDKSRGLKLIKEAASKGNRDAMFFLGSMELLGDPATANHKVGFEHIKNAAEAGHIEAGNSLAVSFLQGIGTEKNVNEAVKWFRRAAEMGSNTAQCNLADMLWNGTNGQPQYVEAAAWYKKSSDQGNVLATYRLGQAYIEGKGVTKDADRGFSLVLSAAKQGLALAQAYVANTIMHSDNPSPEKLSEAYVWYSKAANQGNHEGQAGVGLCKLTGKGVEKNTAEGIEWLTKASNAGNAAAQLLLAQCYQTGEGVSVNMLESFRLFEQAAAAGSSRAKSFVGAAYFSGRAYPKGAGPVEDKIEALRWYRLASEAGDMFGQFRLGIAFFNSLPVGITQNEAEELIRKSADQGLEEARVMYACILESKKDYAAAIRYASEPAQRGDQMSLFVLSLSQRGLVGRHTVESFGNVMKAAQAGLALAEAEVGRTYLTNEVAGMRNLEEGVKWLRKAAMNDVTSAQVLLAYCYAQGEGTLKDDVESFAWFNIAGIKSENVRKELNEYEQHARQDVLIASRERAKQLYAEIQRVKAEKASREKTVEQILEEEARRARRGA